MDKFAIAELPLGAGQLGLCPLPSCRESRARLRGWQPDLVISLTPLREMSNLGAHNLSGALKQAGIGWRHFPVADYGIPHVTAPWLALSGEIHKILAGKGRVAIHCRAGCGRTGMIALRLMVEAGEDPEAAFARLRGIRPCAVETEAQRIWATSR
ncbi:MAG: protein-tyrosine phosphatase family protein [Pseudorhodobacter sp.]